MSTFLDRIYDRSKLFVNIAEESSSQRISSSDSESSEYEQSESYNAVSNEESKEKDTSRECIRHSIFEETKVNLISDLND